VIDLIIALIIGGVVGWLAGQILKLRTSTIGYIALGMGGGLVGNIIARLINISAYGWIGSAAISLGGALLLILILRQLKWIR
jgi:uncharacterized membrane protein YeaQ/YmgE (transglycosylase-associated protein family)